MSSTGTGIGIKGLFRVGIYNADGTPESISDWIPNVVTTVGYRDYICGQVGSAVSGATGRQINQMVIGTHAAPASGDTGMTAVHATKTCANSYISAANGGTMQASCSWSSMETGLASNGSAALCAVALRSSTDNVACIATFATSTLSGDQTLAITYQLRFASSA